YLPPLFCVGHGQMYRALIGHYMQDRSAASRGSHVECMNAGKLSCPKIYCRPGVSWCLPLKSLSIGAYCAPTPDRALSTCFQIPTVLFLLLCLLTVSCLLVVGSIGYLHLRMLWAQQLTNTPWG